MMADGARSRRKWTRPAAIAGRGGRVGGLVVPRKGSVSVEAGGSM